jgi:hypothetical protein
MAVGLTVAEQAGGVALGLAVAGLVAVGGQQADSGGIRAAFTVTR